MSDVAPGFYWIRLRDTRRHAVPDGDDASWGLGQVRPENTDVVDLLAAPVPRYTPLPLSWVEIGQPLVPPNDDRTKGVSPSAMPEGYEVRMLADNDIRLVRLHEAVEGGAVSFDEPEAAAAVGRALVAWAEQQKAGR